MIRKLIKNIPLVGPLAARIKRRLLHGTKPWSEIYWIERYSGGGNSGPGSFHELAKFKAEVLNAFVAEHGIESVVEFGCGDGNQLQLADYPEYVGLDVSNEALSRCRERFAGDRSKSFKHLDDYPGGPADLALSLDVIYHLVEDETFESHLQALFDCARRFVIIYSTDTDRNPPGQEPHVRHRKFSAWIERNRSDWKLSRKIANRHPFEGDDRTGSFADFFVYEKV